MPSVWLICDVSGSMVEAGKRFQARGLIREIEQLVRFGYVSHVDLQVAAWGTEVLPFPWSVDEEVPEQILACKEGTDLRALERFIEKNKDDKHIIFSDCHWRLDSAEATNTASAIWEKDSVRVIALGADANLTWKNCVAVPADESLVLIEEWLAQ